MRFTRLKVRHARSRHFVRALVRGTRLAKVVVGVVILPGLRSYEQAIRDTIGLRKQDRIPSNVAVPITGCMTYHRDLSLQLQFKACGKSPEAEPQGQR